MEALINERNNLLQTLNQQIQLITNFQNVRNILQAIARRHNTPNNINALHFIENYMRPLINDYNYILNRLNQINIMLNDIPVQEQ